MKTISCFICGLGSGGAEHQISMLSNFLVEKGYNIKLVTFSSVKDHYSLHESVERIRLGIGKNKIGQMIDIWQYFLATKSDVVISFGQRENLFCIIPLLFRRNIKLIAGERNTTYGKPSKTERLLHTFLYKRANWIVPNSYAHEKYIKEKSPHFASKVKTIINYTDIYKYINTPYPNNTKIRFGIFCRYTTQKNYHRFAKAIKILKEKGYTNFVADWYGDIHFKDKSLNPHYEKFLYLIKEYNIESYLKLHDKTSTVAKEMSKCDAVILPSLYEGFSNTLSETICCGRPGICGKVADNGLMIHDGINGLLFNPEDVVDIANAIAHYIELSQEERVEMCKSSRRYAEILFNKDVFVDNYIKLIEE